MEKMAKKCFGLLALAIAFVFTVPLVSCASVSVSECRSADDGKDAKGSASMDDKEKDDANRPSITVTNMSVVTLTADTVSFDVTVRERSTDVDKLTDIGNIRSNRIKDVLRKFQIEDVPTRQFRISPYYSYTIIDKDKSAYDRDNETREYKYHEYLHTFSVKIENADKNPELAGRIIDAILAVDDRAEIGSVSFTVSDNRKANASVRRASAQAVMRKIESYAQGSGVELKGIRRMNEGVYTRDTGTVMAPAARQVSLNTYALASGAEMDMEYAKAEDASTQITSDKIDVNAQVEYTAALEGDNGKRLRVSGFSQIKAAPDVARFTVSIRLSGDSAVALLRQGADLVRGLCERLDGECDLTTQSFSLSAFFVSDKDASSAYHNDRSNILDHYEFDHEISVKVDGFDQDNKLGRVIDLVKRGAGEEMSIGGISYSVSDNTPYADEARKGAAANGKEKCEIYADGAGTVCSGVFSIVEDYSAQDTDIDGDELYYGAAGKKIYKAGDIQSAQTVIFRDKVSVRAQLTVTADI